MQSSENSVWLQVAVIRGLLISLSAFAKWWLESKRESTIGITRRQRETSTFMAISYNTIKEPIAYLYCRNYFRHKFKRIKQLVYVLKIQPSQNLFLWDSQTLLSSFNKYHSHGYNKRMEMIKLMRLKKEAQNLVDGWCRSNMNSLRLV